MRGRGFGGRGRGSKPLDRMGIHPGLRRGAWGMRRFRPVFGLGPRPIPWGMFTLLSFASSGAMYKLHRDEVARIEETSGKSVHEMSEGELGEVMKALGIKSRQLSKEDRQAEGAVVENKTTMADLELLEKLTQMCYAGTITEQEYEAKRKQILGV